MSLESFREILLKKSVGNKALSAFVLNIGDEYLVSQVLETLEKMALPTGSKGTRANSAIVSLATDLTDNDVEMIRDALSHHMSHYRAALKAMHALPEKTEDGKLNPERRKLRDVADRHLNHLLPMMDLVAKMMPHSAGDDMKRKIMLDYPPELSNWETNYTTIDRHGPDTTDNPKLHGRYRIDPQLLSARPKRGARVWPNGRGIPDFRYLEMKPHHGHDDHPTLQHEGGYPWEQVRISDEDGWRNGEGFLNIDEIPDKKEYEPHPFTDATADGPAHPIMRYIDTEGQISEQSRADFVKALREWKDSPAVEKWFQKQMELAEKDPEGFEGRSLHNKKQPTALYDGIPSYPQLGHVTSMPAKEKAKPHSLAGKGSGAASAAVKAQLEQIKAGNVDAPKTEPVKPVAPIVRKPLKREYTDEQLAQLDKDYPAGHPIRRIMETNEEFKDYFKRKQGGALNPAPAAPTPGGNTNPGGNPEGGNT